jgi:hypothetical protein
MKKALESLKDLRDFLKLLKESQIGQFVIEECNYQVLKLEEILKFKAIK